MNRIKVSRVPHVPQSGWSQSGGWQQYTSEMNEHNRTTANFIALSNKLRDIFDHMTATDTPVYCTPAGISVCQAAVNHNR